MIQIKGIYKKFENENIEFADIQFENNKSYVILGPSGCGKSTLLNLLSGNIKADGGSIEITIDDNNKFNLEELSREKLEEFRRNNIGYVSQDLNLFENLSVYDNLKIVSEVKDIKYSIEETIEAVGLSKKLKQKVKTLSGGEKQRVCIARVLLQDCNIILCDEPTGSLNQALANEIIELLIKLHKRNNSTLIVVTHDERLTSYFDEVIKYEDFIKIKVGGLN